MRRSRCIAFEANFIYAAVTSIRFGFVLRTTSRKTNPEHPGKRPSRTARARCAAVIPPPPLPDGRSSWQGGSFASRCIPRSRTFGPCTRPDALRLLDFRPGGRSCPPWTSRPGETSLSPWTLIDHGPCPMDPRRVRSAPAPLTNRRPVGCPACGALWRPENKP